MLSANEILSVPTTLKLCLMTEIRRETQMDKILRTTEASAKLNRTSESNFTVWKKKKVWKMVEIIPIWAGHLLCSFNTVICFRLQNFNHNFQPTLFTHLKQQCLRYLSWEVILPVILPYCTIISTHTFHLQRSDLPF